MCVGLVLIDSTSTHLLHMYYLIFNVMLWSLFQKKIKACIVAVIVVVHHNQIQLKVISETISAVELRSLFRVLPHSDCVEWMCVQHILFLAFLLSLLSIGIRSDNDIHELLNEQRKRITLSWPNSKQPKRST